MEKEKDMSIDLNQAIAKGTYSNLAIITHSSSEFILDFATMLPGMPKPDVVSRVIMTPEHAKRLYYALKDNLLKFEHNFGEIQLDPNAIVENAEEDEEEEEMIGQEGTAFPFGSFGNGAQS